MYFRQSTLILLSIGCGILMVTAVLYAKGYIGTIVLDAQRSEKSERIIYGNEKATTIIVEFSDFECPFCAQLHPTLQKVIDESEGTIAWEYRHLPLPMHPNAYDAAAYAECVAKLNGNDAFWKYSKILLDNQTMLSKEYLIQTALDLGSNEQNLAQCVESDAIAQQIETDTQVAQQFGGSGTPFNVIIFPDGTLKPISGALPYANWKSLLQL